MLKQNKNVNSTNSEMCLAKEVNMPNLSDEEIDKIAKEFVESPFMKHQQKVDKMIDDITINQLKNWFENIVMLTLSKGDTGRLVIDSSTGEFSELPDTDDNTAFAWRLADDLQKVFNRHHWGINHHFVDTITDGTYTFDQAIYAFEYKDTKYILEHIYGQGETSLIVTDLSRYKPYNFEYAGNTEVWDYSEIGKYMEVPDTFDFSQL